MRDTLSKVRDALRTLKEQAEVLPAVGGAVEELEQPDAEERTEALLYGDENNHETGWETNPPSENHTLEPLTRPQKHLFRYFQDGSYRSYFLGTLLEHDRETPVMFAQVGACQLVRADNGRLKPVKSDAVADVRSLLLLALDQISEPLQQALTSVLQGQLLEVVNINEANELSKQRMFDPRVEAANQVRYQMHSLEVDKALDLLPRLKENEWLVMDGSLLFTPLLSRFSANDPIPRVIGVAKNFRKNPKFTLGRGARAQRQNLYQLLARLNKWQRTPAFGTRDGQVLFWYLRLRPQEGLDYPLMGVVKVELINPSRQRVDSALIDELSCALIAERNATPHGADRRWHAHLYPIFLVEQYIKQRLISREVIRQVLRWR